MTTITAINDIDKSIESMQNSEIEISKLDFDIYDGRTHDNQYKDKIHVDSLADNIAHFGLLSPIIVASKSNGRYSIVAGRYRTLACKKLGWTKIPARIYTNLKTQADAISISITENTHRADLDLDERIDAIIMHFTLRGYSLDQIQHLSKKIHNFGTQGIPDTFLDAMELCGVAPNTLYVYVSSILYLHPSVRYVAKKQNLGMQKRQLLCHRKLRDHPKIAINLIREIKAMSFKKAQIKVRQKIMDLETGATIQQGDAYIFDSSKREKIDTKILRDKSAADYYLDIATILDQVLFLSTGYRLNQECSTYEPKHIENTEKHRIEILKGLTVNELKKLDNDIDMLEEVCKSWLDLIHREFLRRRINKK